LTRKPEISALDRLAELESSNQILRDYKHIYQRASHIVCSTCNVSFKPVYFKSHLLSCGHQTGSQRSDLKVNVERLDEQGTLSAVVSFCGLTWTVRFSIKDLEALVQHIRAEYASLDMLRTRGKFMTSFSEMGSDDSIRVVKAVQSMLD